MMEAQQCPQPLANQDEVISSAAPQTEQSELSPNSVNYSTLNPSQLIDHLAVILQGAELPERKQVELIRSMFYKKKEQLQSEENADALAQAEIQEERMNDLLQNFKELDRKRIEEQERIYKENKTVCDDLLSKLEALLEAGEDFGKVYSEFHQIREQWEAARPLSPQDEKALRSSFGALRDRFYELKSINEELREYDFRKNLEAKTQLLAEIEPLVGLDNPVQAIKALNPLVDRWHNLGPVARELRAEIHGKFKEFTTAIYKRHQDHHDQKHQQEAANLEAKTAICLELEELLQEAMPHRRKGWDELTARIHDLQEKWKTIGFTGRKDNESIYQRYRASLDTFFQRKSAFFDSFRAELSENLTKKRALLEQAKALKDSTDWNKTAEALKALQAEWTKIGAVPNKYSQRIWNEFRACFDYFFERRKNERGAMQGNLQANLQAKQQILAELEALRTEEDINQLRLQLEESGKKWQSIGHVPHKDKDEVNRKHKELLDELYGRVRQQRTQRRLNGYTESLKNISDQQGGLSHERQRMTRILDRMRSELQTYENNLQFLNISSKGGSSLLKDLERKREKLMTDIELLEEKIKLLIQKEAE